MRKQIGNLSITYETDRFINEVLVGKEYGFMSYYPLVIDIGANIGTFSLSMLDHADLIYAIEPAEENLACLKKTIKDNDITKIIPVQMAVSNVSFVQQIEKDGDAGGGGWHLSEIGNLPVDCRTLKDFMDSRGIEYADLVKIDIEGTEEAVFNTPLFPYKRIGTIIGECHRGNGPRVKEALEWMGFVYYDLPGFHFVARKR